MLIYFHQNKFKYNKGQLAPIFIVFLVVLIIMAMVMVNLSKLAFIKTDSSNAVDAGALAAGTVMANLFNNVAVANHAMINAYWEGYLAILVLATAASILFGLAIAYACSQPCVALGYMPYIEKLLWSILTSVIGLHIAQLFTYCSINEMAIKWRKDAVKTGHKFSFANSGINSKLRQGGPPASIVEPEKMGNYRDTYKQFFDSLGDAPEYTYSWKDGQDRGHFVYSKITIDDVSTFKVRIAALPTPLILGLLGTALTLAYLAEAALDAACACWMDCITCCNYWCDEGCFCCAVLAEECAKAIGYLVGSWAAMLAAVAGILPGDTDLISGCPWGYIYIITWIIDIYYKGKPHNRLVLAETTQHHTGADLGLWNARYPDTAGYSLVSFKGNGEIYPPWDDFDASIIDTDKLK